MTNTLWSSFAKAQSEMKNPPFDSSNPHFKSKYASLAAIMEAVLPPLHKHGISIMQELKRTEKGLECITKLIHESGEIYTSEPLEIPSMKSDAHAMGSSATYARRYQLQAICAVVGDSDDDGNHSVTQSSKQGYTKPQFQKKVQEKPKEEIRQEPLDEEKSIELSLEEKSKILDKSIHFCDKIAECKTMDELKIAYGAAYNTMKKYENSLEGKESLVQLEAIKNERKEALSGGGL